MSESDVDSEKKDVSRAEKVKYPNICCILLIQFMD